MKRILLFVVSLCCISVLMAETVRIGVLLPLKEHSERGTTIVEFYRGLLMAVDAVKQEGISVEVTAMDCGTSETSMVAALNRPGMQNLDVVFGPLDAVQVPTLVEHCGRNNIRMVLPFNTPCPQVYSCPWIYQVGVAQELLYPGISTLIMDNMKDCNFVFYKTGERDDRAQSFVSHLEQVLRLRNLPTTSLAAGGDDFACDRALNLTRENVVVPDSRSLQSLNGMLNKLKAYQGNHPECKVSLLGYPEWLTYTQGMLQDFYQFNTHVFSSYYRNPLSGRVAKFDQQYLHNFVQASRNTFPRAEMLGYDLGYYFLYGLATLGEEFDSKQGTLKQQPVQHTFRFQQMGEQSGFVNTFVQLVNYTTSHTIQIVK